jgi:hypothetical protein
MTKEITLRGDIPLSSFESFKEFLLQDNKENASWRKALNRSSDLYSKIPLILRAIQNVDPTGLAGAVDQILSENKAQREQDRIIWMLYEMIKGFLQYGQRIESLEEFYLSTKFQEVTLLYFEYSERTLLLEKIRLFKNIWLNGIFAEDRSTSEAAIIFDIIDSLTKDEIRALRFIYKETQAANKRWTHINTDKIADALKIEPAYAQQLCFRLRTQGLIGESSQGMTMGSGPPKTFMMTGFTKTLVKYINEPEK